MTVSLLLGNKRFVKFCLLEYGVTDLDLLDMNAKSLFRLMQKWYECPEWYVGPRSKIRDDVKCSLLKGELFFR